jgi:hypothetical protein
MSANARASLLKAGALLLAALVVGWAIGLALPASGLEPEASPTASAGRSTPSEAARLPDADVSGREFERLPRYPGAVRTAFRETVGESFRLVAAEYLVDAPVEEVRAFYQSVIGEKGWQRADIGYHDGDWTYVLVDGRIEALVEIEVARGLVEIDLQVSLPVPAPPPSPTESPDAAARSPAPAPPPPPPDDDGDDDGGDDSDDDSDDDDGDSDG